MKIFLSGGAKCGKSSLAQQLTLSLAGEKRHYYIATLRSTGREDDARIARHIADRAGLGFETVECFQKLPEPDPEGVYLVDSVTSLLQNAMFSPENNYVPDVSRAQDCIAALEEFTQSAGSVVFVNDDISSDAISYDAGTEAYRRCLASAGRRLASLCDTVAEVVAGQIILYKGGLPL